MKNKILISSIILIVLLLGLSVISATDTNTTMTDSIEKQTIDFKTDNTKIDTKEIKASEKNTIRTKDLTNNFVYSYISLTKQQIISFYEKKENKTFKYWIIFIISFLLTLPLALLEFAGLLDIIFFL